MPQHQAVTHQPTLQMACCGFSIMTLDISDLLPLKLVHKFHMTSAFLSVLVLLTQYRQTVVNIGASWMVATYKTTLSSV